MFKAGDKVRRDLTQPSENWINYCKELALDPAGLFTIEKVKLGDKLIFVELDGIWDDKRYKTNKRKIV